MKEPWGKHDIMKQESLSKQEQAVLTPTKIPRLPHNTKNIAPRKPANNWDEGCKL